MSDLDPRNQKIVITPDMIEAGAAELREKCLGESLSEIATDVFYAMLAAYGDTKPSASSISAD